MKYLRKKKLNEAADPTLGGVSYTVQGMPGYRYAILPLTHDLEQHVNQEPQGYYIHPGCTVTGVGANNPDKHFTGQVLRIVKNGNGEIQYLYIKTTKTNKYVTIRADKNLRLITFNKQPEQLQQPYTMSISRNMKI